VWVVPYILTVCCANICGYMWLALGWLACAEQQEAGDGQCWGRVLCCARRTAMLGHVQSRCTVWLQRHHMHKRAINHCTLPALLLQCPVGPPGAVQRTPKAADNINRCPKQQNTALRTPTVALISCGPTRCCGSSTSGTTSTQQQRKQ
jgi:hypothetical protein